MLLGGRGTRLPHSFFCFCKRGIERGSRLARAIARNLCPSSFAPDLVVAPPGFEPGTHPPLGGRDIQASPRGRPATPEALSGGAFKGEKLNVFSKAGHSLFTRSGALSYGFFRRRWNFKFAKHPASGVAPFFLLSLFFPFAPVGAAPSIASVAHACPSPLMFITLDFVPLPVSIYLWNPAPPSFLPTLIECFSGFPHLGQLSVFVFPRHLQRGHFSNSRPTASSPIFLFQRSLLPMHRFHLSIYVVKR